MISLKNSIWYLFVFLNLILFIFSLIYNNIYLTLLTFALAMFLNKFLKNISSPKAFDKFKTINFKKEKL